MSSNDPELTCVELINKILKFKPNAKKCKLWRKKKCVLVRILVKLERGEIK